MARGYDKAIRTPSPQKLDSLGTIRSTVSSKNRTSHAGLDLLSIPFVEFPVLFPPVLFPPVLLPVLLPPVLLPPVLFPLELFPPVLLLVLFPLEVQFDQNAIKSGVWPTERRIVSFTLPLFETIIETLVSSPGAISTSPLSPAFDVSIAGRYCGKTVSWTPIVLDMFASGSVTVFVIVPELLGSAEVDSLIAMSVVALRVGITPVTFESAGITSQTESKPETEIEYVSIDEPLLLMVKVMLVASPGDKTT